MEWKFELRENGLRTICNHHCRVNKKLGTESSDTRRTQRENQHKKEEAMCDEAREKLRIRMDYVMCSKSYNNSVFIQGTRFSSRVVWWLCHNDVGYFAVSDLADDVSKMISRRESVSGGQRWMFKQLCAPASTAHSIECQRTAKAARRMQSDNDDTQPSDGVKCGRRNNFCG